MNTALYRQGDLVAEDADPRAIGMVAADQEKSTDEVLICFLKSTPVFRRPREIVPLGEATKQPVRSA